MRGAKFLILGEQWYFVWDIVSQSTRWLQKFGGPDPFALLATPMLADRISSARSAQRALHGMFFNTSCLICCSHNAGRSTTRRQLTKRFSDDGLLRLAKRYDRRTATRRSICRLSQPQRLVLVEKIRLNYAPCFTTSRRLSASTATSDEMQRTSDSPPSIFSSSSSTVLPLRFFRCFPLNAQRKRNASCQSSKTHCITYVCLRVQTEAPLALHKHATPQKHFTFDPNMRFRQQHPFAFCSRWPCNDCNVPTSIGAAKSGANKLLWWQGSTELRVVFTELHEKIASCSPEVDYECYRDQHISNSSAYRQRYGLDHLGRIAAWRNAFGRFRWVKNAGAGCVEMNRGGKFSVERDVLYLLEKDQLLFFYKKKKKKSFFAITWTVRSDSKTDVAKNSSGLSYNSALSQEQLTWNV